MQISHLIPILNVRDVPASIAWFEKWGWRKAWAWHDQPMMMDGDPRFEAIAKSGKAGTPSFASVCVGEGAHGHPANAVIFLCRDGQGGRDDAGVKRPPGYDYEAQGKGMWMSIFVEGVDEIHRACVKAGLTVLMPPTDEPWGMREFHLQHPDGHVFRVGQGAKE